MISINGLNGILNVLKPPGMTSFDVVAFLRRVLGEKKIGHAGTLDPGAAGVLPVCIGRATKAIQYMMDKDKAYRVELTLGISTDTQDSEGKIIRRQKVKFTEKEIEECIKHFTGKIAQTPPMYSAIRVDGKRLYELARAGVTVERKTREVLIFSSEIVKIKDGSKVLFDVVCSKGTYMRTLCSDIGDRLGCGGHMSFLIRTRAGSFHISEALTLEDISGLKEKGELNNKLIGVGEVFKELRGVNLNEASLRKALNGAWITIENFNPKEGELIGVYNLYNDFIALGEAVLKQDQIMLKLKKVF